MKTVFSGLLMLGLLINVFTAKAQVDSLPVRGLCIGAPMPAEVDSFVAFINNELAPRKVNTLVLRVDYNYQYQSHPELADSNALSKTDVKKIVASCKRNNIQLIPEIDLLGHQSWANRPNKLLQVYPQFDETPWIKMPEHYEWPNADSLYCKSYCPLYPGIHKVIFDLIDELCDAFESNAFHAGMDEVFYIGEDKCPRCGGKDKSKLFADEVTRIHDHLAKTGKTMWMWGDRFLDGRTTGLGMWEASYNDTYRAIDMIPKDVVICDWHYERPDKTPVYFSMKGLNVMTCSWRKAEVADEQIKDMINFRRESTPEMAGRFRGMMETVWQKPQQFIDGYYQELSTDKDEMNTSWNCFIKMFPKKN